MVGVAHAKAGRDTDARSFLAMLEERAATSWVSPVLFAQLHAALGDTEATLQGLELARDARATDLVWIGVRPAFDAVRLDARFESLVRDIGLTSSTA
jgi:hypothetical protein